MQLIENECMNLQFRDLLDKLLEMDLIDQSKRVKLETFRLSLNPEHHTWTELSHEDRIALAADVLDFIYSQL